MNQKSKGHDMWVKRSSINRAGQSSEHGLTNVTKFLSKCQEQFSCLAKVFRHRTTNHHLQPQVLLVSS